MIPFRIDHFIHFKKAKYLTCSISSHYIQYHHPYFRNLNIKFHLNDPKCSLTVDVSSSPVIFVNYWGKTYYNIIRCFPSKLRFAKSFFFFLGFLPSSWDAQEMDKRNKWDLGKNNIKNRDVFEELLHAKFRRTQISWQFYRKTWLILE